MNVWSLKREERGLAREGGVEEVDSFLMFDNAEGLGENTSCLGCRGNMMDVHIAGIEDMSDIMVSRVNVFAAQVIHTVFDMFEGRF